MDEQKDLEKQKQEQEQDQAKEAEKNKGEKTFTQDEVDKIVSSRLTKAQKKWKDDTEAEKAEAEKLAKMSADQKKEHELNKLQEELNILKEKDAFNELRSAALNIFNEKQLPIECIDFVITKGDADKTNENIETFGKVFNDAVLAGVNSRIQGHKPKVEDKSKTVNPWAKGTFNLTKQAEVLKENPKLAEQLRTQA